MAQLVVAAAASWAGTAAVTAGLTGAAATAAAASPILFGMTAGQLGFMAGSLVGSMLFQNNPSGPKIEQGKFSSNIYGQVIPLNYGTQRHATQIAWWSGLQIRTEGGGKKSGSYELARMDLLLAVCEGPQAGVLRIWANGRLIYDATVAADPFIDSEVLPSGEIRVYLGTETQVADPTYEAAVGTDFAIPYRGTVMVAIDGLEGALFANRPPNIEVEVCQVVVGGTGFDYTIVANTTGTAYEPLLVAGTSTSAPLLWSADFGSTPVSEGVVDRSNVAVLPGSTGYTAGPNLESAFDWVFDGTYIWALKYSAPLGLFRCNPSAPYDIQSYAMTANKIFVDRSNNVWYTGASNSVLLKLNKASPTGTPLSSMDMGVAIWNATFDAAGNAYVCTSANDTLYVNYPGGTVQTFVLGLTYDIVYVTYIPPNNSIYVWTGGSTLGELVEWSIDSQAIISTIHTSTSEIPPGNYSNYGVPAYDPRTGYVWATGGGSKVKVIDTATGDILYNDVVGADVSSIWGPVVVHPDGYAYVTGVDTTYGEDIVIKMSFAGIGQSPVTLQSIVEDLCDRSGLAAANLDASAGIDLVAGFKIATQTSARAAIDSLRPVYFFDMPEKGEQIVMVKRGGASVATIDSGELGASIFQVSGSDNTVDYELDHIEEQEVPRRLEVTYVDYAANYDPGIQAAERQTGSSLAPLHVEAPVVLTEEQAAKVAWANLLMAHSSKNRIRFNLSHHYDALIPSDPIAIPHSSGESIRVRIETITRARPLLEIEGVPEEQSVYTQVVVGIPRYQGPRQTTIGGSVGGIGDTLLVLLDVPPLRDADNSLLVYSVVARDTYVDSWSGASLYKSSDGGASYDVVYSTTTGATIGVSTGALGDWTKGNIWDDTNTLTVILTSGTFSSSTDLGVLNGANGLAVKSGSDWEIVQFATATLVGTNTWELTRLLRGRHGTERCIAGHANGDTVVLLYSASIQTVAQTLGEVGAVRQYKGVTSGQAVADAVSQNLTLAGRSLMPLSPVHIAGTRDAGDLTITWVRRARINADWNDSLDVPLDEATESYSIDVMNGASVVRTLTSSTPTVEYTAAQQTTDFGSAQSAVLVNIYQLSATVGRGHPGEATV